MGRHRARDLHRALDRRAVQGDLGLHHATGIRAIGGPVLGLDGVAIAAISTAAPAFRVPAAEMAEHYVPPLRAAARELAALLPARGDYSPESYLNEIASRMRKLTTPPSPIVTS